MLALVFGLFGLVIGSFLNVVILRHGLRSIAGRSSCPACGRVLSWTDLVPVFSWLFLRGRCRSCGASISKQYPLVEAATGILFAFVGAAALPVVSTLAALVVLSLFICIFVYDLYHTIIPDVWVWPLCLFSFLFALSLGGASLWQIALSGLAAASPIFFLWAISRGAWMGFGDVKLSLAMGFLLGFPYGLVAVMFAFVIGAAVSVGILLPLPYLLDLCGIRRKEGASGYTMKSEVPFGPFLIASCLALWFALLFGISIPLFS